MTQHQDNADIPSTLNQLISAANFRLHWFDLGRRVRAIAPETAAAFEAGETPWPHPYLRHAWCGLLLSPKAGESDGAPVVWFLRLPLDEQGKLLLPIRDRFLRQLHAALTPIVGAAGNNADSSSRLQRALDESGLIYTPPDDRRAVFHAKAAQLLKHPASSHYAAAKSFAEDPKALPWQQLALQGIADLAVRWPESKRAFIRNLAEYPAPFLISLCQCLESEAIDHHLAEPLIRRAQQTLTDSEPDLNLVTAVIRGVSHSIATGMRQQFLLQILQSDAATHGEILAAIGSRCSDDLQVPELAQLWLENLSASQPQQTFNLLLTDLLFIPQLRNGLLGVLRNPERKESVARAFGEFLQPSGT
ncbi:DUF3549 family protein [uncultured Microbulbifer sp.]|uniref:DUF3549 family protein n=1 Tax=uncultured Microbulbifer sp. TaxID=348147 RepID=UPI0025D1A5BA|nr:DUF3549 family protein [uncultured Microbulbifer sp.]